MRDNSPLQTIATCMYSAIYNDMGHGIQTHDITIKVFSQTWGSTALGFTGVGGQAMTQAYTVCIEDGGVTNSVAVYFGGRLISVLDLHDPQQYKFYQDCVAKQAFPHSIEWKAKIAKM